MHGESREAQLYLVLHDRVCVAHGRQRHQTIFHDQEIGNMTGCPRRGIILMRRLGLYSFVAVLCVTSKINMFESFGPCYRHSVTRTMRQVLRSSLTCRQESSYSPVRYRLYSLILTFFSSDVIQVSVQATFPWLSCCR
jgi:hypothetical protein